MITQYKPFVRVVNLTENKCFKKKELAFKLPWTMPGKFIGRKAIVVVLWLAILALNREVLIPATSKLLLL